MLVKSPQEASFFFESSFVKDLCSFKMIKGECRWKANHWSEWQKGQALEILFASEDRCPWREGADIVTLEPTPSPILELAQCCHWFLAMGNFRLSGYLFFPFNDCFSNCAASPPSGVVLEESEGHFIYVAVLSRLLTDGGNCKWKTYHRRRSLVTTRI